MENILYLAPYERTLFEALPAELKKKWEKKLRTETIDAYETSEVLEQRMKEGGFDQTPEFKKFLEKAQSGITEGFPFEDFPEDQLPNLLFNIGASGIAVIIIGALKQEGLTNVDMEGIAALSQARHNILQTNAVLA